ncbi:MAG: hypothetical protein COV98_04900 [Candidatus Altarchaeum sp. CG12_big_fil_rev_8_21_14_0_65_33_22]|nr:MAG: hypothetical protein COV98_04900 [Candidatus Altarchaeum sp. CG12_big_fil_rev_8_21_14_0_65_33_22]
MDKYKNSEISTIEIEIIYAICKEYFRFRIPDRRILEILVKNKYIIIPILVVVKISTFDHLF